MNRLDQINALEKMLKVANEDGNILLARVYAKALTRLVSER